MGKQSIQPGLSPRHVSLVALPDGAIGLLFERGDRSPYERITFARFTLEWLTEGKDRLAR